MKGKIINLLKTNCHGFISGQDISEQLGVSRTAIWKYINIIKEEGYEIEATSKKGYKLISSPDILTKEEVGPLLKTQFIGRKLIYFSTIDSTNTKAKELANLGQENGTIVISEEQTGGRGRLGRNFMAPKGKGIWMSIILRPEIDPLKVSLITLIAAAAVNKASTEFGVKTLIKWPNDVMINRKKACGILTEMSGELNKINYVILGIGINVNLDKDDFTEEISEVATSYKLEYKKEFNRKELMAAVINKFELLYNDFVLKDDTSETIEICRDNSILLGKEIIVINRGEKIKAKALNVNDEGLLVVEYENGSKENLISGEISIRGF